MLPLLFFVFLFASPLWTLDLSFKLDVLPLKYASASHHDLFYTNDDVLGSFEGSQINSSRTLSFGMATPRIGCVVVDTLCPLLKQIMHVDDNGQPRLVELKEITEEMKIIEEAGYVSPWPGYCGTSEGALIEMFSEVTKRYFYATSADEIDKARRNEDGLLWHPIKVIGYMYSNTNYSRTMRYPFNSQKPLNSNVFNKKIINLSPIIELKHKKNDKFAYTVFTDEFSLLRDYKKHQISNISLVNQESDFFVLQDACGPMTLLMETFNQKTGSYSIRNLNRRRLTRDEQIIRSSGFIFNKRKPAERCIGEVEPLFEMRNKKSAIELVVGAKKMNQMKRKGWKNLGRLGFASHGNFAFVQLNE